MVRRGIPKILFYIPLAFIKEITILGDKAIVEEVIKHPENPYQQSVRQWAENGGTQRLNYLLFIKNRTKAP